MNKKVPSTSDMFIKSLTPKELKKFKDGYKDFALSELLLAVMEHDEISVRKLEKIAGVSPTIVQAMRSGAKKDFTMQSFFKVLNGLGCKKMILEINDQQVNFDISNQIKK
jgi:hypothetical protein